VRKRQFLTASPSFPLPSLTPPLLPHFVTNGRDGTKVSFTVRLVDNLLRQHDAAAGDRIRKACGSPSFFFPPFPPPFPRTIRAEQHLPDVFSLTPRRNYKSTGSVEIGFFCYIDRDASKIRAGPRQTMKPSSAAVRRGDEEAGQGGASFPPSSFFFFLFFPPSRSARPAGAAADSPKAV